MLTPVLSRSILLFLITTCVAISIQSNGLTAGDIPNTKQVSPITLYQHKPRVERGLFFHKKKSPGFFQSIAGIILEQWTDTRNTIKSVNKLVNDNFLPESESKNNNAAKIETTSTTDSATTSSDSSATTTTERPFRITRTEFNRLLRRNILGLVRIFNLELRDALKLSKQTDRNFRKNASAEFSKYLYATKASQN